MERHTYMQNPFIVPIRAAVSAENGAAASVLNAWVRLEAIDRFGQDHRDDVNAVRMHSHRVASRQECNQHTLRVLHCL